MKLSTKIQKACQHLFEKYDAEFASGYGEPGYQDMPKGVILANWNNVPDELARWLESVGFQCEWSDEWTVVNDKAYRTQADSYHWQSSTILTEDCEYITVDEPDEWVEECTITQVGQRCKPCPSNFAAAVFTDLGFELVQPDCEAGWFPGQTDDPAKIAAELLKTNEAVVFQLTENSQFYTRFTTWARKAAEDVGE